MRVGFDMDEVIYDFIGTFRRYLVTQEGFDFARLSDPLTWDFSAQWGLTQAEVSAHIARGVERGIIYWGGIPMPGALESVDQVLAAGHDLVFITSRTVGDPETIEQHTRQWLDFWVQADYELHITADKTGVHVDTFVDDRLETVREMSAKGVEAYCLAKPWNYPPAGDVEYVYTVCEYVDRILEVGK